MLYRLIYKVNNLKMRKIFAEAEICFYLPRVDVVKDMPNSDDYTDFMVIQKRNPTRIIKIGIQL